MNNIEIPQVIKDKVFSVLHKNEKWIYYENRLKEYTRTKNKQGIDKMKSILEKLERDTLQSYIDSVKTETVTLHDLMQEMSEEDREYLNVRLHGIVFMCDIVDSLIRDAESKVCKYFPDSKIETYDKVKMLGAEAKLHINTILETSNEKNKQTYFKYADKITDAALPYIRSFIQTQERLKAKEARSQQRPEK